MEQQVLEGVKVCQNKAITELQESLKAIIKQRAASIRPVADDSCLGGSGEERLMSTHMFRYTEGDIIDAWDSLISGALHENARGEAVRLLDLSERMSDIPQQKAEVREMFENLFRLALMRKSDNAEFFLFRTACDIGDLHQGKTRIWRESMERFFDIAKRVVIAAFEDNKERDPEVAVCSLDVMASIGDDEMAASLNRIASDRGYQCLIREKADGARARMRVRDELESAREMKERYLAMYPHDSGQWLYINMVYTAIETVFGSDGKEEGMGKVDLMSALHQLAGFGDGPASLAALFKSKEGAARNTPIPEDIGFGALSADPLADLRSEAEDILSNGFPGVPDGNEMPLSVRNGESPDADRILESISYDIENALAHALRSKDRGQRTIAAYGLRSIGNGHVDYVLGKMLERYGRESGIGQDVAMILWIRASARLVKEKDFGDVAGCAVFGWRNKPQPDKRQAGDPDKRRTIV